MPEAAMQAWKPLLFEEAVQFWSTRIPALREQMPSLEERVQARAFTVAGIAKLQLLNDLYTAIYRAIAEGGSFEQFKRDLQHIIEAKGWTGKRAFRVQTIFRTNIQTAYQVGHYQRLVAAQEETPYWQYDAVGDSRTRPTHAALDGKVFRADDPFWDTWYPPNGFNCRCTVRAMSAAEVRGRGLEVEKGSDILDKPIEVGPGRLQQIIPDPGFARNAGRDYYGGLVAEDGGKATRLPGLAGPDRYGLPAFAESASLADAPELLPRGLDRDDYEREFRRIFGFEPGMTAVMRRDVLGDPTLVPEWLARKVMGAGLERGAFIPVLPAVLSEAQEVWLVPYRVGDRIRLRKHLLFGWRGRNASGAIVVAELDGSVWREISMSPLNDRTIEQKRRGVLVWRKK